MFLGNNFDAGVSLPQPSHPPKAVNAKVLNLPLRTPPLKQKTPPPPLFFRAKNLEKIFKKINAPTSRR